MTNPWLKKNPFMSMWLSGANTIANKARGHVAAEAKRQSATAMTRATNDIFSAWSDALTGAAPRKRTKRRTKR